MAVAKKSAGVAAKAATKKPVAKKVGIKKSATEKTTVGRSHTTVKKAHAPRTVQASFKSSSAVKKADVPGYEAGKQGILTRTPKKYAKSDNVGEIVPASNLTKGIAKAKDELNQAMQTINSVLLDNVQVTEIEVSVSFNAKGEFLGFGVGSSLTMKLKIQRVE